MATSTPIQAADPQTVSVIDVSAVVKGDRSASREIGGQIKTACEELGFFQIVGHGIEHARFEEVFAANRTFHALSEPEKMRLRLNKHFRGFQPLGGSRLKLSTVETARLGNHSESFFARHAYNSSLNAHCTIDGPNQWPSELPQFRPVVEHFHDRLAALGRQLIPALAFALGLDPDDFAKDYFERPSTTLRLLHYPPHPTDAQTDLYGIAPHTDYGFLTLLAQDSSGGLQIRAPSGAWLDISPRGDALVINVGDALSRMTGGRFASTPHRVVNPSSSRSRYSVAMFFDPNLDAQIGCLPGFTARVGEQTRTRFGDYFLSRLDANYPVREGR